MKNAERGTVEALAGTNATIRWDSGKRQDIDLGIHKTWDHGYAETVYSAQSKTYARAYVLAPVNSPLVTGQNYYTAITRARLGVKLWTEDEKRLVDRLMRRSGEKTSALEGLGRLDRDARAARERRHGERLEARRMSMRQERVERQVRLEENRSQLPDDPFNRAAVCVAGRALGLAESLSGFLTALIEGARTPDPSDGRAPGQGSEGRPSSRNKDR